MMIGSASREGDDMMDESEIDDDGRYDEKR
jgi:hypothetical protein